jgi:hypothetical protein
VPSAPSTAQKALAGCLVLLTMGTLVSFGLVTLPILAREWIDEHRQPDVTEEVLVSGAGGGADGSGSA